MVESSRRLARLRPLGGALALALAALLAACQSTGPGAPMAEDEGLESRAEATIAESRREDPGIEQFYDTAAGYVVFPSVGKGGLIVGGASGRGVVYNAQDEVIGYARLSAASIGAQIGGQSFSEIIFFEEPFHLERFKRSNWETGANASAVALDEGASAAADYDRGVAIFLLGERGLMLEASVSGQKFDFYPLEEGS